MDDEGDGVDKRNYRPYKSPQTSGKETGDSRIKQREFSIMVSYESSVNLSADVVIPENCVCSYMRSTDPIDMLLSHIKVAEFWIII